MSDIETKSRSSPMQEKRNIVNIFQASNKATCDAIERLAKIPEDQLDKAIDKKKTTSLIMSTRTKMQPEPIIELLEPDNNDEDREQTDNPFDPGNEDDKTKQQRMNKLRLHQNKLSQMSKDLTEELDNINVEKWTQIRTIPVRWTNRKTATATM